MKDIAIYGAGGYGKEVACLINRINDSKDERWNLVGFFDDGLKKGLAISHFGHVLGGMNELNCYDKKLAIVLAMGNPKYLKSIRNRIINDNIYFPNIIAPDFVIVDDETFSIGEGNVVGWGCSVSCDVSIGSYNILNADDVLGHDVKMGSFNVVMPDIRISGEVTIGECNLFGVGSIILQQIIIGNNVRLGAGAVLMTKPKDDNVYIGNPAKIFKF